MTAIEWTNKTWNPVSGCTKVSPGCDNCYAETFAERFGGDFSKVVIYPERLEKPMQWKKPQKIFVNSMSDLFHEDVPDDFIERVFETMAATPQHTYQILTKRAPRMHRFVNDCGVWYPNIWLGVSVESRLQIGRIYHLRHTHAKVKFISFEPLIGSVVDKTMKHIDLFDIHWAIVGGESGHNARPMQAEWAEEILVQCREQNVAFFMKQMGSVWIRERMGWKKQVRKGGNINDFPETLKVREFPA